MSLPPYLRAIFSPPAFADEDQDRLAKAVHTLVVVVLVSLLPIIVHNVVTATWPQVFVLVPTWLLLFIPLSLGRRGATESAGLSFTLLMVAFISTVILLSPLGIYDVASTVFPILIVAAGIILDRNATFIIAVLIIVSAVMALYLATLARLLPDPVGRLFDVWALIDVDIILVGTALLIRFLRRQFAESLRRLRRSEQEVRALFDSSPEAIVRQGLSGRIVAANSGAAEILGLSPDKIIGRVGEEFVVPADRARALREMECVRAGTTIRDVRIDILRPDGAVAPAEMSAAPLRDHAGVVIGVVIQSRDIGARLRAEERFQELQRQFLQAQKMESIGRLAGGVAHDLNNFLTAIIGFGELAKLHHGESERNADLDKVLQAGDRARAVVGQLLAFARRQVLQPQDVALNELVAGFAGLLRPLIGEQIALRTELAPDTGTVRVDPSQIEQVIINLVVNARDAMPDGGELLIATGCEQLAGDDGSLPAGEYATLLVRDSGTGLSLEAREHLFEPFFTTKPVGKGTGLGLATCHGIVRQSAGEIRVVSTPGGGTTFTVFLPLIATPTTIASAPQSPVVRGTETILFVEDEELVRAVVVEGLREFGYVVLTAVDGLDALDIVERHPGPIAIMVSDLVMPGMNGRQLAEQLRDRHPEIQVLFTSGYAEDAGLPEEFYRDRLRCIRKPYTPAQLASRIREVLAAEASAGGADRRT